MADRKELENLIEAALADNKLTSKEMQVLIKKAKQLGIDEDEFIIEINAKKHIKKKLSKAESNGRLKSFLNSTIYHRDAGYKTEEIVDVTSGFKRMLGAKREYEEVYKNAVTVKVGHIVIPIFSAILLTLFIIIISWRPNYGKKIDEALVKYDIENAYIYLSKERYPKFNSHQKILNVAIPYYLKEGNTTGALNLILEYKFEYGFPIRDVAESETYFHLDLSNYNEEVDFFNGLLLQVSNALVAEGNPKRACEIVETNLRPFADEKCKQTFDPISNKISYIRKNCNKR